MDFALSESRKSLPFDQSTNSFLFLLILCLSCFVFFVRWQSYGEAYERDLMIYAMTADGWLNGMHLYSVMWDHKPPAIHWTYGLFIALTGLTPVTMFLLGLFPALLSLAGCFLVGQRLHSNFVGIMAALIWAVVNSDIFLQANQANTEVFINTCLIWAFFFTLRLKRSQKYYDAIVVGCLFFLASLYKQVAAISAMAMLSALLLLLHKSNSGNFRKSVRLVFLAGLCATCCWAAVIAYFGLIGDGDAFWEVVFAYNRFYSGRVLQNMLEGLTFSAHPIPKIYPYIPMFLLSLASLPLLLQYRMRDIAYLLGAFLTSAYVAIAMPGRFYPHYYQLALPPITIITACIIVVSYERRQRVLLTVAALAFVGTIVARTFQESLHLEELPYAKYSKAHAKLHLDSKTIGPWIAQRYSQDETIYHWGNEPGVYFWARRSSPSGFVFNSPLFSQFGISNGYVERVLGELKAMQPDLIVASKMHLDQFDDPIATWIRENYVPINGPKEVTTFLLFEPKPQAL